MKRLITLSLIVLAVQVSFAQPIMQASIGIGSGPSKVKVYVKPTLAVNGQISTLNFNVGIPASVTPVPTMTITNNPFPGATFQINFTYTEGGYINYNIANLTPFNVTIGAGVETEMLELSLSNGTPNSTNVSLVSLPDGGSTTPFALFYCTGAASSNGSNNYYVRAGTIVNNQFSYTSDPNFGNPPGTSISTATLGTLSALPVKWMSFDVIKQNNDALLTWTVDNEENNKNYEVQRTITGTNFTRIGTVDKVGNGNTTHSYSFTDHNISSLNSPVIYYRIKQVDIDGKYSYSEIRKLNIGLRSDLITVYPNPVTNGFYIAAPGLPASMQKTIHLVLTSSNGQVIQTREITAQQAANYYFDIKNLQLSTGIYLLQIIQDGMLLDKKQLLINK